MKLNKIILKLEQRYTELRNKQHTINEYEFEEMNIIIKMLEPIDKICVGLNKNEKKKWKAKRNS